MQFRDMLLAFGRLTGCHVCIHAYHGLVVSFLDNSFRSHVNPHCSLVKKRSGSPHRKCIYCDSNLTQDFLAREGVSFYKVCHAGFVELAVPIYLEGALSGCLFAGPFMLDGPEHELSPLMKYPDSKQTPKLVRDETDKLLKLTSAGVKDVKLMAEALARLLEMNCLVYGNSAASLSRRDRIAQFLASERHRPLTLKDVADHIGVSESRATQLFREYFGRTFPDLLAETRLDAAKFMLINSCFTIEVIARETGFSSAAYFFRVFRERLGMTPGEFRRQNQKAERLAMFNA